jgi:hypothetical protein
VSDIDMDLKRVFDERLRPVAPPPRTKRRPRKRLRVAAAAAAMATVAFAGVGLAMDVNSVAATNGLDCASFPTKLQVWAQSHRSDLAGTDHSAAKAELAKMVAASGCAPHDATHDRSQTRPHH